MSLLVRELYNLHIGDDHNYGAPLVHYLIEHYGSRNSFAFTAKYDLPSLPTIAAVYSVIRGRRFRKHFGNGWRPKRRS